MSAVLSQRNPGTAAQTDVIIPEDSLQPIVEAEPVADDVVNPLNAPAASTTVSN
jgi:hypothetical protein